MKEPMNFNLIVSHFFILSSFKMLVTDQGLTQSGPGTKQAGEIGNIVKPIYASR
jgi:hypothetical protein